MENTQIISYQAETVFTQKIVKDVEKLEWNKHPVFKGVYLKHLVTGADTENKFSCHIVKVDPGCILDNHIHEGKWEIHEVIEGQGTAYIGSDIIGYKSGAMAVIPDNMNHKVCVDNSGLVLLAKFIPALL